MTPKTILFFRAKSVCFGAAIILTTVMLFATSATPAAHAQTFTKLYDFLNYLPNPLSPSGPLVQGRDGNLYGTTSAGGTKWPTAGGTVFKITPTGALTVLWNFDTTHGSDPEGGLAMGAGGNFYGTTHSGGTYGFGTVFKLAPSGALSVLYNFTGGSDGGSPYAPPMQGTDGGIYGTTYGGGLGYGTVYRIAPSGQFTVLHQFDSASGEQPYAPLIQAADGNFYGTTYTGGAYCCGTAYRLAPSGALTVLYDFPFGLNGYPKAPLVQGSDGNFYGVGSTGSNSDGYVFRLTPAGTLTVLHQFGGPDGRNPDVGLVQATDGNFYGATPGAIEGVMGVIYRVSLDGVFSPIYHFDHNGVMGAGPDGLVQHTNGLVYGVARNGGTYTAGTFFSLDMGLQPFARLISSSGQIGKNIGVLGQGFTGTTSVSFNGIAATFTVSSDTYLETIVPVGALKGPVTVTTPTGTLTSNKVFHVWPKILGFSPTSGTIGTPVVITGTGLTQTVKVGFGGVAATSFTVDSDTQITAIVPAGAVTGKIAVATQGGHDTGAGVFTVMP